MSNNIMPFAFGDNLVRVIKDENGEPWFVAKDVALALNYEWAGIRNVQHVPEEWRRVESVSTLSRGTQEMWLLSEQGLYFFLGRSDKPGALPFQKWMAGEVMPSIRKTGSYTMPNRFPSFSLPEADAPHFPPEALRLRPVMRQRLWQDAMQAARLDNAGSEAAVEWFGMLCRLMQPQETATEDTVQRFAEEGCEREAGFRIGSEKLWQAYSRFCLMTLGKQEGQYLSNKAFSGQIARMVGVRRVRSRPTTIFAGLRPLA